MKKLICVLFLLSLLSISLGACTSTPPTTVPPTQQSVTPITPPTSTPEPQPSPSQKGTITISGAFALYPMMQIWAEKYQAINPQVNFDISAGGAGKGLTDTLSGAVDIGMVSRAISPAEEAKGAYWVSVSRDAVFPVVSDKNPVLQDLLKTGLKKDTFIGIYITGTIKTWGQAVGRPEITDEIHVYTRSDASGAADAWAQFLGGKKQDNLQGIGVSGDPGIVSAVAGDADGIGYNNLNFAFDTTSGKPVTGISVLPIDANSNGTADSDELFSSKTQAVDAVSSGKYPSPPARFENLVTNGKPSGLLQAFIRWIITDGQKYCLDNGQVPLAADQQSTSLQKIH